ncbi:unnamed protein product [Owenia fusiformis]|uniref:Uncharacterized protein n=1 Tax=Owenia fusiformis TaxID=6347 RepID=A0A8J1TFU3_OWEFU|nr:unnamed protein product [Owenia fusiformis]
MLGPFNIKLEESRSTELLLFLPEKQTVNYMCIFTLNNAIYHQQFSQIPKKGTPKKTVMRQNLHFGKRFGKTNRILYHCVRYFSVSDQNMSKNENEKRKIFLWVVDTPISGMSPSSNMFSYQCLCVPTF